MAAGNISSEKIDLLIYGPSRPILENGFSDQFVLHAAETKHDLERLTPAVAEKIRGIAVTYHTVHADKTALALFPKLEIVASFGVGYDHVDSAYAREHNIVVTNTPDVLTEEVADVAMGLLIATLREFVKADRYLRSGALDHAELSAQRRLAARPQGRHRRHGPDRPGDRAPARCLARSRGLSFAQAGRRRVVQALSRPDRDGEGGRYAGRDRARRRVDRENDQCRCA